MKTKDMGAERNEIEPLSTEVHTQPVCWLPAGFLLASGLPGPTDRTRQVPEAQSRITYWSC